METAGIVIYHAFVVTTAVALCYNYMRMRHPSYTTAVVGVLGGAVAGAAWPITFALLVVRG